MGALLCSLLKLSNNTVQYGAVRCSIVQYYEVQYSTVSIMQYGAVQCSIVQYSAVYCSTV